MTTNGTTHDDDYRRVALDILRNVSYEIMPFKDTEDNVLEHVPRDVALTVTVAQAKGIDVTVDLAGRLAQHGYRVAPHLAARAVKDKSHASDLLAELTAVGISEVFIVGGDIPSPAGEFTAAINLLEIVHETGNFHRVGFGGYPEGHATISEVALQTALKQKAPLASHVITQICFDAETTVSWARHVHENHPQLGVVVGVPAPVGRQKLMRISASIGLGQSARFLRKQQALIWRLIQPGGYRPDKLLRTFVPHLGRPDTKIEGIHLFTFNELRLAETWRQESLLKLCGTTHHGREES
ncbi:MULTISPECIES: methylenetetrahydrofolate reductase [unclassified Mycolicibacterium]|uniref:methylenetetrahydrofolate reductase n=1 Tax=unclassified Mycolicibacterium TaxID=2636767 RepID=UPI002EDA99C2